MKPTFGRVVLKPLEETPTGLLIIPDAYRDLDANDGKHIFHDDQEIGTAEVLAVGPGKYSKKGVRILPEVKVGDTVLYHRPSASKPDPQSNNVFIEETAILCVVEHG